MTHSILVKHAGGAGLPKITSPDTAMLPALAALQAADVRMMFMPVSDLARLVDGQRFIQDALRAQIEYRGSGTAPVIAAGPTQYGTGGAPSATLGGVAGVRGWLGNQAQQFDSYGEQVAAANPPFWGFVVAKLGTDTDVRMLFNVDTDTTGYGDCLLVQANESLEFRIGGRNAMTAAGVETTPTAWHIYSWNYTPGTDTIQFYRDGVATFSYVVQTSYPGAQLLGGFGQLCGRAASSNIEPHDGANAAVGVVAAGNGVLSDAGHTAIVTWLKGLFSIA